MEFVAKKDNFLLSLNFICSHLKSSFIHYCCINADNELIVSGFDTTSVAKAKLSDFEVKDKGRCYVDVFILKNAVKHSSFEDVHIKTSGDSLNLESGSFTCSIPLVNEEYSFDPINDDEVFDVVLQNDELKHALLNVLYAAGADFEFVNVEVDGDEEELRFIATDGSRLSISNIPIDYNRKFLSTVIHKDSARVLLDYVKRSEGTKTTGIFLCKKGAFGFRGDDVEYITKPVIAKFPDYKRAIPSSDKIILEINIDRKSLVSAFKKAMIFSEKGNEGAVIEVKKPDSVFVSSKSNQGSYSEKFQAEVSGEADRFAVFVNPKFFLQTLTNVKSDNIVISFTGTKSGIIVTPEEDNCFSIIMPMVIYVQ